MLIELGTATRRAHSGNVEMVQLIKYLQSVWPYLLGELQTNERPYLKKRKIMSKEQHPRLTPDIHMNTYTQACTSTNTSLHTPPPPTYTKDKLEDRIATQLQPHSVGCPADIPADTLEAFLDFTTCSNSTPRWVPRMFEFRLLSKLEHCSHTHCYRFRSRSC